MAALKSTIAERSNSLEIAKVIVQDMWDKFIEYFDAVKNVDKLFSRRLIDDCTMGVILKAGAVTKDANRAFLLHLKDNATIDSLKKLCQLLHETSGAFDRHIYLATLLEAKLKQAEVPSSHIETNPMVTEPERRPFSRPPSSSELSGVVLSEEDAAFRLGIAALDLREGAHHDQQRLYTDKWLDEDPPQCRLHDAFVRLLSRLAKLFDKHIDDLKPALHHRRKNEEWPFKLLEKEDIENACTFKKIFAKVCIEDFWLDTRILIRLINVLPDKNSQNKAKQHLEAYHKLLGVFSKFVLLKHIPRDDDSFKHFRSSLFPKLRITYDVDLEGFAVSKLLENEKFLSKMYGIDEDAFRYLKAEPTQSTLVTWALCISPESVVAIFERAVCTFWSLKENLIINFEIGGFQLHLTGKDLPRLIKEAFQSNQDFLSCTESVSLQFSALVDYSHPKQRMDSEVPLPKPSLQHHFNSVKEPKEQEQACHDDDTRTCQSSLIPSRGAQPSMEQHSENNESMEQHSENNESMEQSMEQHSKNNESIEHEDNNMQSNLQCHEFTSESTQVLRCDDHSSEVDIATDNPNYSFVESLPSFETSKMTFQSLTSKAQPDKDWHIIKGLLTEKSSSEQDRRDGDQTLRSVSAGSMGNVTVDDSLLGLHIELSANKTEGATSLHQSVSNLSIDHRETTSVLLKAGCPDHVAYGDSQTALFWASSQGNVYLIHFLIGHGANVNEQDEDGRTPLHLAVGSSDMAAVNALLNLGAGPSLTMIAGEYGTPLHQAIDNSHSGIVAVLVNAGYSVDVMDIDSQTALHRASLRGKVDFIKYLISHGSNVNMQDDCGGTPLHLAACSGNAEAVKTLLNLGAKPSLKKVAGKYGTPLHQAVSKGHKQIVPVLLDAGCPADVEDGNGETTLHWASARSNIDLIHFLINSGSKVNKMTSNGWTSLHFAASSGNVETVETLLNLGAGPSLTKVAGEYDRTPLDIAIDKDHKEVVALLRSKHFQNILVCKPDLKSIKKHVLPNLKNLSDWFQVGFILNVPMEELQTIQFRSQGDNEEAYCLILTAWLNQSGATVTWKDLLDALENYEAQHIVQRIIAGIAGE